MKNWLSLYKQAFILLNSGSNTMERNIKEIVSHFSIEGECLDFKKNTTGHINDSYYIDTKSPDHPGYFLQWINSSIFRDVEGLMNNICAVTGHLATKLAENKDLDFKVLEVIPCKDGKNFYLDPDSQYWRLYIFIDNAHGYNVVENIEIAYEGGKAFGLFMSLLVDLPAKGLTDTIPDFHNMEKRLETFYKSLTDDKVNRVKDVAAEIEFVKKRAEQMLSIPALIKSGELPLRITHNDTKFNNIMFDSSDHALCIVDLDTVMPGSILFDFGDSIRTGANTANEDEKDLSKVDINLPIYEAYSRGFLKNTRSTLTEAEINNLAFSARFMTFIIGLRFLTDFLDGDTYFRTSYPDHNQVRTKVQFRLIEAMERNAEKMNAIVIKAIEE
ncbi:MAG: phosphotransferase [Bacteroidales bacterium]|nr:phosphotransferase [Bacteroidales bacterium]